MPRRRKWLALAALAVAGLTLGGAALVARPPLALADHLPLPLMIRARMHEMGFTQQQRADALVVVRKHAPTMMPLVKQMVGQRRALHDLVRAEQPDEVAIRAQVQRASQTAAELAVQASRLASDLGRIATPEQKAKMQILQNAVQLKVDAALEFAERWLAKEA